MGVMPTVAERVSVVEVQIANLDERFDELKEDVHTLGSSINTRLDKMHEVSCIQHAELGNRLNQTKEDLVQKLATHKQELDVKIDKLEQFKNKGTMYLMIALAFLAGTGWIGHLDIKSLIKFVGL